MAGISAPGDRLENDPVKRPEQGDEGERQGEMGAGPEFASGDRQGLAASAPGIARSISTAQEGAGQSAPRGRPRPTSKTEGEEPETGQEPDRAGAAAGLEQSVGRGPRGHEFTLGMKVTRVTANHQDQRDPGSRA